MKCVHNLFRNEFLEDKSVIPILHLSVITFILDVASCSYNCFGSYKNFIAAILETSGFNNNKSLYITATIIVRPLDSNYQNTFETSPDMCCGYKDILLICNIRSVTKTIPCL